MPAKVGFILKGYPRLSETFIAQEIFLLEERGLELEIFSMRAPRESDRHPVHEKIRARITYLPESGFLRREVMVVAIRGAFAFPFAFLGAFAHAIKRSILSFTFSPLKRLAQAAWLVEAKKIGSDSSIAHFHAHFIHAPGELAFYLSWITGLPFSLSAHAKDIYTSRPAAIRERVGASLFLTTCTDFNRNFIRSIVGKKLAEKVHRVYHGVDLTEFFPTDFQALNPKRRLITVARLVEKKGYDDVLQALAILRDRGLVLSYDIWGSGQEAQSLAALVNKLRLEKQVIFHGSASRQKVLEAYREGGVFVLASRETKNGDRDGIPNSLAEAMSMALPVVSTRASGIPELVEHEVSGLLVGERDPVALANAIERIYCETGLAPRLGKAARNRVEAMFDADRCINRCFELLAPQGGIP